MPPSAYCAYSSGRCYGVSRSCRSVDSGLVGECAGVGQQSSAPTGLELREAL